MACRPSVPAAAAGGHLLQRPPARSRRGRCRTTPRRCSRCSSAKPMRGSEGQPGQEDLRVGGRRGQRGEGGVRREPPYDRAAHAPRTPPPRPSLLGVHAAGPSAASRSRRSRPRPRGCRARREGGERRWSSRGCGGGEMGVHVDGGHVRRPTTAPSRSAARGCGRRGAAGRTRRRAGSAGPRWLAITAMPSVDVPAAARASRCHSCPGSQAGTSAMPVGPAPHRHPSRRPGAAARPRCRRPARR